MLERQHTQLIAGLQKLYHLALAGQTWPADPLEPTRHGQPLTHQILEGLGVLQSKDWDDITASGGSKWESFEQQELDRGGAMHPDDLSDETTSPVTATTATFQQGPDPTGAYYPDDLSDKMTSPMTTMTPTFSPTTAPLNTQTLFRHSKIMANRRQSHPANHMGSTRQTSTAGTSNDSLQFQQPYHVTNRSNEIGVNQMSAFNPPPLVTKQENNYHHNSSDMSLHMPQPISPSYNTEQLNYLQSYGSFPQPQSSQAEDRTIPFGNFTWMSDIYDPPNSMPGQLQDIPQMQQVR